MEKIGFWDIVRSFEARWFMSVMSTGAVGIFTQIIAKHFDSPFLKGLANLFVLLAFVFLILVSVFFTLRIFKFFDSVLKDLQHPIAANFFAGINISLAVLATAVLNVLIPNGVVSQSFGLLLAKWLYILALIIGLFLLVLVPVMLIISKKVETKHAIGIWFLPPVGMFVVAFAGNFLAIHNVMRDFIIHFNMFLFGPALILYFLILNLIYYRLKFHPLPAPEVAPSFVIGLAPVGVSVIAFFSYVKLLKVSNATFLNLEVAGNLAEIFASVVYGFGFWWFLVTFIILSYYIIKHKIPYTLGFWAFVFPIAAFGIGTTFFKFKFMFYVSLFIWLLVLGIWCFVFTKTLISIINKKAFIRPKVIN